MLIDMDHLSMSGPFGGGGAISCHVSRQSLVELEKKRSLYCFTLCLVSVMLVGPVLDIPPTNPNATPVLISWRSKHGKANPNCH